MAAPLPPRWSYEVGLTQSRSSRPGYDFLNDPASALWDNALILAPMVRAGTLPLRLLSLDYGADTVYGEEVIDHKVLRCVRKENPVLGTVDFVIPPRPYSGKKKKKRRKLHAGGGHGFTEPGTVLVFRTCPAEHQRVVFQLGSGNAVRALQSAQLLERDVSAIDLNMGCPKHFSISGGMGASLLQRHGGWERAVDIIKTLRRNLSIPVSCKIRLCCKEGGAAVSQDANNAKAIERETVELLRRLAHAGAQAIGVHVRSVDERPKDEAHWESFPPLVSAMKTTTSGGGASSGGVSSTSSTTTAATATGISGSSIGGVPLLLNGDIFAPRDVLTVRQLWGASSVMLARGALWNPSIFKAVKCVMSNNKNKTSEQLDLDVSDGRKKYNRRGRWRPTEQQQQQQQHVENNGDEEEPSADGTETGTCNNSTSSEQLDPLDNVIAEYFRTACACANGWPNTKYQIQQMLKGHDDPGKERARSLLGSEKGEALSRSRTWEDGALVWKDWGIPAFRSQMNSMWEQKQQQLSSSLASSSSSSSSEVAVAAANNRSNFVAEYQAPHKYSDSFFSAK